MQLITRLDIYKPIKLFEFKKVIGYWYLAGCGKQFKFELDNLINYINEYCDEKYGTEDDNVIIFETDTIDKAKFNNCKIYYVYNESLDSCLYGIGTSNRMIPQLFNNIESAKESATDIENIHKYAWKRCSCTATETIDNYLQTAVVVAENNYDLIWGVAYCPDCLNIMSDLEQWDLNEINDAQDKKECELINLMKIRPQWIKFKEQFFQTYGVSWDNSLNLSECPPEWIKRFDNNVIIKVNK